MPDIRYLDNLRTQELIDEIKRRLATKNPLFQYTTLPTPSASNVGETYQYVGATTLEYASMDFYKVIYDAEATEYKYEKVTYNKEEIDALIDTAGHFEVVEELPTTDIKTNVIYLVPKVQTLEVYVDSSDDSSYYKVDDDPLTYAHFDTDGEYLEAVTGADAEAVEAAIEAGTYTKETRDVKLGQYNNIKDEYINLDGTTAGWEKIGDTKLDLSGYVKFDNMIPITQPELVDMWKDNGVLTLDKNASTISGVGNTDDVEVTAHSGAISAVSSDDTVATVAVVGTTVTITSVAVGTATVTVTSAATSDYREATADVAVTVE